MEKATNLNVKTVTNVKCHLARQSNLITCTDLFLNYKTACSLEELFFPLPQINTINICQVEFFFCN